MLGLSNCWLRQKKNISRLNSSKQQAARNFLMNARRKINKNSPNLNILAAFLSRLTVRVIHNWSPCSWHDQQQPRMEINQQNERLILPTMITKGWGAIFRYRWAFIHDGDIGRNDWSSGWVYLLFFSSFSPFYSRIWLFNPRPAGIYGNFVFFCKQKSIKWKWDEWCSKIFQQHTEKVVQRWELEQIIRGCEYF